jgi:hypothetical protein
VGLKSPVKVGLRCRERFFDQLLENPRNSGGQVVLTDQLACWQYSVAADAIERACCWMYRISIFRVRSPICPTNEPVECWMQPALEAYLEARSSMTSRVTGLLRRVRRLSGLMKPPSTDASDCLVEYRSQRFATHYSAIHYGKYPEQRWHIRS